MQPSFVELGALYHQRHYLLAPGLACGELGTEKTPVFRLYRTHLIVTVPYSVQFPVMPRLASKD